MAVNCSAQASLALATIREFELRLGISSLFRRRWYRSLYGLVQGASRDGPLHGVDSVEQVGGRHELV
jgi:hypothetical protein